MAKTTFPRRMYTMKPLGLRRGKMLDIDGQTNVLTNGQFEFWNGSAWQGTAVGNLAMVTEALETASDMYLRKPYNVPYSALARSKVLRDLTEHDYKVEIDCIARCHYNGHIPAAVSFDGYDNSGARQGWWFELGNTSAVINLAGSNESVGIFATPYPVDKWYRLKYTLERLTATSVKVSCDGSAPADETFPLELDPAQHVEVTLTTSGATAAQQNQLQAPLVSPTVWNAAGDALKPRLGFVVNSTNFGTKMGKLYRAKVTSIDLDM